MTSGAVAKARPEHQSLQNTYLTRGISGGLCAVAACCLIGCAVEMDSGVEASACGYPSSGCRAGGCLFFDWVTALAESGTASAWEGFAMGGAGMACAGDPDGVVQSVASALPVVLRENDPAGLRYPE